MDIPHHIEEVKSLEVVKAYIGELAELHAKLLDAAQGELRHITYHLLECIFYHVLCVLFLRVVQLILLLCPDYFYEKHHAVRNLLQLIEFEALLYKLN